MIFSFQPASQANLFAKVIQKPKLQTATEKVKTSEVDIKKELKRGSMKEKWGLTLDFRIEESRISLRGTLQF